MSYIVLYDDIRPYVPLNWQGSDVRIYLGTNKVKLLREGLVFIGDDIPGTMTGMHFFDDGASCSLKGFIKNKELADLILAS